MFKNELNAKQELEIYSEIEMEELQSDFHLLMKLLHNKECGKKLSQKKRKNKPEEQN